MSEYEIIDVNRDHANIRVIIGNLANGRRETYAFPLGEGYEDEDASGELRCVKETLRLLEKREDRNRRMAKKNIDMNVIKEKYSKRKISFNEKGKSTLHKKGGD